MSKRYLPDANIFLHTLNLRSAQHEVCRRWLDNATAANLILLINDLTECAFLRISTLPRLGFSDVPTTLKFWHRLLEYKHTERINPRDDHSSILSGLIVGLNLCGNDVNDAWLAALAMEHGAILVSTDEGFARFPKLNWANPLQRES